MITFTRLTLCKRHFFQKMEVVLKKSSSKQKNTPGSELLDKIGLQKKHEILKK